MQISANQITISIAKLAHPLLYEDEQKRFVSQITKHGWCRVHPNKVLKPTTKPITDFFNASDFLYKRVYSNTEHNIGYIASSTNERVRVLTGKLYENILDADRSVLASHIVNNALCKSMDDIAWIIFKMICKFIIKEHWIKIASENEICLRRNYYYSYKIAQYIVSHWSKHQFVCVDIVLLISTYYAAEGKESFNYGMFEAIQYNKPLILDKNTDSTTLLSVNEHFDVGFCVLGLGETCQGLQLLDRERNEFIDADFDDNVIYIWIGSVVHELCNGRVPVGIHRVKWCNEMRRISYIYEICVGEQIKSLSFENNENIKIPYKCLKEIIVPIDKQKYLRQNVMIKQRGNVINVVLKSLNGNKTRMCVHEHDTVKYVKMIIMEKEGIPTQRLRIIFKGKLLNDTDVLSEKGVKDGMTLYSALMLRD